MRAAAYLGSQTKLKPSTGTPDLIAADHHQNKPQRLEGNMSWREVKKTATTNMAMSGSFFADPIRGPEIVRNNSQSIVHSKKSATTISKVKKKEKKHGSVYKAAPVVGSN